MSSTVVLGICLGGFFFLSWVAWKVLKSVVKGVLLALVAVSIFYYLVPVADDRAEIIEGARDVVDTTKDKVIELAPKAKDVTEKVIEKAKEVAPSSEGNSSTSADR